MKLVSVCLHCRLVWCRVYAQLHTHTYNWHSLVTPHWHGFCKILKEGVQKQSCCTLGCRDCQCLQHRPSLGRTAGISSVPGSNPALTTMYIMYTVWITLIVGVVHVVTVSSWKHHFSTAISRKVEAKAIASIPWVWLSPARARERELPWASPKLGD